MKRSGILESTTRQLTVSGAPTTAEGLIEALRRAGLEDTRQSSTSSRT